MVQHFDLLKELNVNSGRDPNIIIHGISQVNDDKKMKQYESREAA